MIIQRLFSSKTQKARRKEWDLKMAEKAEDGYKFKTFKEPNEADRVRKGRKAVRTNTTDQGFKLNGGYTKMKNHVRDIHEGINKSKPNDILEASKLLGNTEAKKRVGERFSKLGGPKLFEFAEKGGSLRRRAENIEHLKKNLKRGGLGALAVGGAVAAGVGAKKMIDKKKAEKSSKKD